MDDPIVNAYWRRRSETISALRTEFDSVVERLASELTDAKTYMDAFVAGNVIDGRFYQ